MCGIAGMVAEKEMVVRQALTAMTNAQCHRGPDDSGDVVIPFGNAFLGLGQRRLSIIDLSPAGHQPMIDPATGSQLIFNGEIYNFAELRKELDSLGQSFRGHSDTEVMLYGLVRWGPEYVKRLQGMFAFAFFDAKEQTLMLARDSLGIKPLYIAQRNGQLLFASEVRALLASGLVEREIDVQGVAGLLAYSAVPQPTTIIRGVRSFPAGSYQIFRTDLDQSDASPTRFWSFPTIDSSLDEERSIDAIRKTLDAAVRDHLVADRPVGIFLSSGLDSTIVAGLAARHSPHIRSFTVGFSDQKDFSEQALAQETAKLFGLQHESIDVSDADALKLCIAWLDSLDQPSSDGLNVYILSQIVRARGIVVALSGQGGDELFGGYSSFQQVPQLRRTLRSIRWLPAPLRSGGLRVATVGRSEAVRQKLMDMAATDASVVQLCLQRRRAMSSPQLQALGLDPVRLGLGQDYLVPGALDAIHANGDAIATISQCESTLYQGNVLLRDSDTNGMAHSLEIRVPILDQRMLELAYAIPGQVRLPNRTANKHLLRRAFGDFLRPELTSQAKRGFTMPLRRWMLGPLRELCESSLESLRKSQLLRNEGIDEVWQLFLRQPESPIWSRAFTLVVLGHYLSRLS